MQSPHPRRPAGIVLSAIALGLAAFLLVLAALGSVVTALGGAQLPTTGGASAPPAAFFAVIALVMTFLYLGLAGWAIGTLVGLLRMRSWARVSTMVIAGCLAGFGFVSALAMLGVQSAFASGAMPAMPNVPPAMIHKILIAMTVASLVVAVLGALWLVYLAQRRTREAFFHARAEQLAQQTAYPPQAGYVPSGYTPAPPAWPRAPAPAPDPLTDFTVARPLGTTLQSNAPMVADPAQPEAQSYTAPPEWPQPSQPWQQSPQSWPVMPPGTPVRTGRPTSVTVLAIFSLISAFFSLFGVISPVPTFLFGMVVSGWPLHLYSLVWAAAMAIAGLGMLRLQRPAWLLSFVLLGISALQLLVLLLPGSRARYVAYMTSIQQHSIFGGAQPALPASLLAITMASGMVFGLAVMITFAILLWRARWAFATPPPAPPAEDLQGQA